MIPFMMIPLALKDKKEVQTSGDWLIDLIMKWEDVGMCQSDYLSISNIYRCEKYEPVKDRLNLSLFDS